MSRSADTDLRTIRSARQGTGRGGRVPPGPPRRETIGLFGKLVNDRLGLMSGAAARYGDAVRIRIGPKALYLFNHPDHAKHVLADNPANYHKGIGLIEARRALGDGLLTSEGDLWRKQRTVIQPAFGHKRIAEQAGAIAQEAAALVIRLRAHEGTGPVDVTREMTALTLGVLGRTLLATDLSGFGTLGDTFEAVQDQAMFEMVSLSMVPDWVPLRKQLRFRQARREQQAIVRQVVDDRRAGPAGPVDDVLSRLISSTDQEADPRVRQQRLQDELITLLLAGHETTASTLSWAFYLADRHPEVWERLRAEATEVLGDRLPVYADLTRLSFTTMVVEESMRLYPPVWALTRVAQQADEVGGWHVPAGADVMICPYTLHRNPQFWPEPDRFDPERFGPGGAARSNRYAYIPFGAGPRFCVGNHLGMMEAVFVIAVVARELRLAAVPGFRAVPRPNLSLRVSGGLPMTVRAVA